MYLAYAEHFGLDPEYVKGHSSLKSIFRWALMQRARRTYAVYDVARKYPDAEQDEEDHELYLWAMDKEGY